MNPAYCCLLCDHHIKEVKDKSTVEMAKSHLRSSLHKLKYLVIAPYAHA